MTRSQRILLGILVVQVAILALATFWGRGGGRTGHPLLPEFAAERVTRLVVASAGGDSVVVERTGDGWALPAYGGYPADSAKAEGLLRRLAELEVESPTVESDRYHASLEVAADNYQRRLRLYFAEGGPATRTLWLGRSPSPGLVYARVSGSDAVYELDGLETYAVPGAAAAWIRGKILEFDASEVQRFALRNRAGSFAAERSAEGWTRLEPPGVAGRTLDTERVDGFLRAVSSIYAVEPVGAGGGGDDFEAVFQVDVGTLDEPGAGELRGVRIGPLLAGELPHRPVASLTSPHRAAVHENSLVRLLNETWGDLLARR